MTFSMAFSTKMLNTQDDNADANHFSESELMSKIVFFCQPDHLMRCHVNYLKSLYFAPQRFYFLKIQCQCLFPKPIYIENDNLRIIKVKP